MRFHPQMEKVFVHVTELHNQTDQTFEFEVENRCFRVRALPPDKKGYVKLWKVLKATHECPKWKMRLMMNKDFSGIEVNANQLLSYAKIIIKLQRDVQGLYLPYLEAIMEKRYVDYWLRLRYFGCVRDKYWDKRAPHCRIWPDRKFAKELSCRPVEELPREEESNERELNASPVPAVPEPAASPSLHKREKKVTSLHVNNEKPNVSSLPAAALQPEEHGPPKKESIRGRPDRAGSVEELQRGSVGNMPEPPQQKAAVFI